ncbi:MAG: hypothetical protein ABIF19_03455 [Planctomycetota bacterium]
MNRLLWLVGLLAIGVCAGCESDIVCTKQLKMLEHKCVHIAPIESEDPHVGQVVRDVIEKEFIRRKVDLCDPNTANVFITGTTFLTVRSASRQSQQAIESVSLVGKDRDGEILLSASYDNKSLYTASKLAHEFGQALAGKLK